MITKERGCTNQGLALTIQKQLPNCSAQDVTTQRGEKRKDVQTSWALGDLGLQQAHLSPPFCPPGAESGSSQAMGMEGMNPCPPSKQL